MKNLPGWKLRSFYFACLILVPFLKFLAHNSAGLFHPEIAIAIAWLLLVSAALGAIARGVLPFYGLVALCAVLTASYEFESLSQPLVHLPLWLAAVLVAAFTLGAMRLMRGRFFPILAVFLLSSLGVELAGRLPWPSSRNERAQGPGGHVLWLILDEQIGLAGFPHTDACEAARDKLQATLAGYNFTLFPNAYSNYSDTIDSVPSIVNDRLLRFPHELIARTGAGNLRHYQVVENRLFAHFALQGYKIIGYQHGSLRECAARFSSAECRQYEDRLGWLYRAPGGWAERFRWIVGTYQAGDPLLGRVKGFFPFRFGLKITGPLALTDLWPDGLARDILAEPQRNFIFAHLLTPHSPYLFRRDGSIRPLEVWANDRADERVGAAEYSSRYRRYCEQSEFAAVQLGSLLAKLNAAGMLGGMTVVVHGDHGSRIRRTLGPPEGNRVMPDVFDYTCEPPLRDLKDRFSTLLAIKLPGSSAPAENEEKHSVLTFLSRLLYHREPYDGAGASDRVYLTDRGGHFHPIDILSYWR